MQRLTINDPWNLPLPQRVMDAIEQASALTGQPPEQIVAAAVIRGVAMAEAEKKKPSAAREAAGPGGSNVSGRGTAHAGPVQLLLPLRGGSDEAAS